MQNIFNNGCVCFCQTAVFTVVMCSDLPCVAESEKEAELPPGVTDLDVDLFRLAQEKAQISCGQVSMLAYPLSPASSSTPIKVCLLTFILFLFCFVLFFVSVFCCLTSYCLVICINVSVCFSVFVRGDFVRKLFA